jgi:myo-inositol-1-phosphate synthase
LVVNSPNVKNDGKTLESTFEYRHNKIVRNRDQISVTPQTHQYRFKTQLKPQKTGLLLVGIGGNNGTTVLGATIANREQMEWKTRYNLICALFIYFRNGTQKANYFGSITQSTTVHLGWDGTEQIYLPFNKILPLVDPNDLIIDGWDINNANMYEAALRARVINNKCQINSYYLGIRAGVAR